MFIATILIHFEFMLIILKEPLPSRRRSYMGKAQATRNPFVW